MTTEELISQMSHGGRVALIGAVMDEIEAADAEIKRWREGVEGPPLAGGAPCLAFLSDDGMRLVVKLRNQIYREAWVMARGLEGTWDGEEIRLELMERGLR